MGKVKKRKKRSEWDKLYDKTYGLWKDVCFARDGEICQVQKNFGHFEGIRHSDVLQVDHCFSRDNKHLHLNPSNGTVVCSSCNAGKSWKGIQGKLIDEIVKKREGLEAFQQMMFIAQSKSPLIQWKEIWYLEDMIIILENIKKEIENGKT